jgi:hypothetical protein
LVIAISVVLVAAISARALDQRGVSSSGGATGQMHGLRCTALTLPEEIPAQVSMAWAPSGARLAVGRIRDSHSTSPVELLLLSEPTWAPVARGNGSSPHWSASGALVSAFDNGALRVLDAQSGAERARVATTAESAVWSGQELRYWSGSEIRAWSSSGDRLLARVGLSDLPSLSLETTLSSDGDFFAITRFDSGGSASDLYVGRTADGNARRENAPARGYHWSSSGHVLFIQHADSAGVRFDPLGPETSIVSDDPTFFGWDQSGARPLIRAGARGDATMLVRATDGPHSLGEYSVPASSGALQFTADGRYGATTAAAPRIRTLSVLRCLDASVATGPHTLA